MTHFEIVHELNADPPDFWKVFHDEAYNVNLYKRLGMKERTVSLRREDDETIEWKMKLVPQRDLPGFMKKIVGGDFGYVEHSTYYKGKDYIDVRITPTLLSERIKFIDTRYSVKSIGPGRLRRTYEGDVNAALPLVGGKIERVIIDDIQKTYDLAAQITAEYLARR